MCSSNFDISRIVRKNMRQPSGHLDFLPNCLSYSLDACIVSLVSSSVALGIWSVNLFIWASKHFVLFSKRSVWH